jgi:hypothetical protein
MLHATDDPAADTVAVEEAIAQVGQ